MNNKNQKAEEVGQGAPPAYDPAYAPQQQYYQQQPGAYGQPVTMQPQVIVYQQPANDIPDHMAYAICVTLCCCWPLGIFAIVKALASRDAVRRGDLNEGRQMAAAAKRYSNWALGIGIVFILAIVIFLILFYTVILPNIVNGYYD